MQFTVALAAALLGGGLLLVLSAVVWVVFPQRGDLRAWATSWTLAAAAGTAASLPSLDPRIATLLLVASEQALGLAALRWWGFSPSEGRGALARTLLWGGSFLALIPVALGLTDRDVVAWALVSAWMVTPPLMATGLFALRGRTDPRPSVRLQSRGLLGGLLLGPVPFALLWTLLPLASPDLRPWSLLVLAVGAARTVSVLYRYDTRFLSLHAVPFVVERTQDPVLFLQGDGRIQAINPALSLLLDQDEKALVGRLPSDLGAEPESRRLLAPLESLTFPDWEGAVSLADRSGHALPVHVVYRRVHNTAREAVGAVLLVHDLRLPHRLDMTTREDALTSLANRRWVMELLEAECLRGQHYELPLSVLVIHLDDGSDDSLRRVAATLRGGLRKTDFCGRIGENEFLVVFPETGIERVRIVAGRLERMYALSGEDPVIRGYRVGVAGLDQMTLTAEDLVARAQAAVPPPEV